MSSSTRPEAVGQLEPLELGRHVRRAAELAQDRRRARDLAEQAPPLTHVTVTVTQDSVLIQTSALALDVVSKYESRGLNP